MTSGIVIFIFNESNQKPGRLNVNAVIDSRANMNSLNVHFYHLIVMVMISVAEPVNFFSDPDPRIRFLKTDPDPGDPKRPDPHPT